MGQPTRQLFEDYTRLQRGVDDYRTRRNRHKLLLALEESFTSTESEKWRSSFCFKVKRVREEMKPKQW